MSTSDTAHIARSFIRVWTPQGIDLIDDLAVPDIRVAYTHFPQPITGAEAFKSMLEQTFEYFPDMRITVEEVLASGDRAMLRWYYEATHQNGVLFGVLGGGQRVKVKGITRYRIRDGKVREEIGVVDNLGLMQQLGVL